MRRYIFYYCYIDDNDDNDNNDNDGWEATPLLWCQNGGMQLRQARGSEESEPEHLKISQSLIYLTEA